MIGRGIYGSDMDFQSPQPIIEALKQRVEHGVYGYTLRPDSYMESIVGWLKRRHRWSIEKEWITHSPVFSGLAADF